MICVPNNVHPLDERFPYIQNCICGFKLQFCLNISASHNNNIIIHRMVQHYFNY